MQNDSDDKEQLIRKSVADFMRECRKWWPHAVKETWTEKRDWNKHCRVAAKDLEHGMTLHVYGNAPSGTKIRYERTEETGVEALNAPHQYKLRATCSCDICGAEVSQVIYHARVAQRIAFVCPSCFKLYGCSMGEGRGVRYEKRTNGSTMWMRFD